MSKKTIILGILSFFMALPAMSIEDSDLSQTSGNKQTFRFVYIAPDNNMSQQQLLADLNNHRNYVVLEGSPAIFYLVSNNDPLIVKFNMSGDNSDEFENQLLYNLRQTMSWSVDANFDRQKILSLFRQYDFIDNSGELVFDKVEFDFHVGKTFWDRGNNEAVIAALFFELNAAKYLDENRMQFNVFFRCPPSKGTYDGEKPFGEMNLDDINSLIGTIIEKKD